MRRLRIAAFPRDPNPYQEDLYRAMRAEGAEVDYLGELTASKSLNLLLMPLELAVRRARGLRVLHLHWTFGFSLPFSERSWLLRRISRAWFAVVLAGARVLGVRVVWTAHNVLPHARVFDDDLAARRRLVADASLVLAHSPMTLQALAGLGAAPARAEVIPHGLDPPAALLALEAPAAAEPRQLLFFGRLETYKGVEDLLAVWPQAPGAMRLLVAGACADAGLAERLRAASAALAPAVELRLGRVADADLGALFAPASACVLPFRSVTTSGSVLLAMASGRPVLVPDLPALGELPDDAVLRYPAGRDGLARGLARLATLDAAELAARGRRGREVAGSHPWEDVAAQTGRAMRAMLSGGSA